MLARRAEAIPVGNYLYEPKWDGFRCLAKTGVPVELRSRHGRPLARYFPEIVAALAALPSGLVLDGELVMPAPAGGGYDFAMLLSRLHPTPSRVAELSRAHPARFVIFDLLFAADEDWRPRPFAARRARLAELMADAPAPLRLTPITEDPRVAAGWLAELAGKGVDGVVAKARDLTYQAGRRAMIKVKPVKTADCVVAGVRLKMDAGGEPTVGSLLLGLYDGPTLRHVGVASSFKAADRRAHLESLRPLLVPLAGHPWENGFNLRASPLGRLPGAAGRWDPKEMERDWFHLRPERVCEVSYDAIGDDRFRHAARFIRWRPDRIAASCGFAQLGGAAAE